jgi:hypothetical protein
MRDPAGEQLPLDPAHGHARHVSRPAEEAAVVVLVHGGDAEALVLEGSKAAAVVAGDIQPAESGAASEAGSGIGGGGGGVGGGSIGSSSSSLSSSSAFPSSSSSTSSEVVERVVISR